jgi:hypothetical protein
MIALRRVGEQIWQRFVAMGLENERPMMAYYDGSPPTLRIGAFVDVTKSGLADAFTIYRLDGEGKRTWVATGPLELMVETTLEEWQAWKAGRTGTAAPAEAEASPAPDPRPNVRSLTFHDCLCHVIRMERMFGLPRVVAALHCLAEIHVQSIRAELDGIPATIATESWRATQELIERLQTVALQAVSRERDARATTKGA